MVTKKDLSKGLSTSLDCRNGVDMGNRFGLLVLALVFVLGFSNVAICGDWQSVSVKKDHYLGVSSVCSSLGEARDKALREVLCQVLRSVGASYSLKFDSSVVMESGGAGYQDNVSRRVSEKFHYSASAFLSSIERNVVSSSYRRASGVSGEGFVYRILVYFPPRLIERARRLSLGAKVVARFVGTGGVIEVKEVNGVKVVLKGYVVSVVEKNRHADFLNYYVMNVSGGGSRSYERAFSSSVVLTGGAVKRVRVVVPAFGKKSLGDLVLGTSRDVTVSLRGTDEVGRPLHLQVPLPSRF
jgi:hypothetical protein